MLICPAACGIFPNQGSNSCPLHWQVDSQLTGPTGKSHNLPILESVTLIASAEFLQPCNITDSHVPGIRAWMWRAPPTCLGSSASCFTPLCPSSLSTAQRTELPGRPVSLRANPHFHLPHLPYTVCIPITFLPCFSHTQQAPRYRQLPWAFLRPKFSFPQ